MLVHRQQNTLAAQKVQTRVKNEERKRRDGGDSGPSSFTDLVVPPPQRLIGSPVTACSVFKLYDDYSLNSGVGIFEALPILGSAKHAPCFSHALNAAALASGAEQLNQPGLLVEARQSYGKAILALRRTFQDSASDADDSILASLFVLGLFEVGPDLHIMDIFLNSAEPASLRTEFEAPWSAWPRFYPVEQIVQASVDLMTEIKGGMSSRGLATHTVQLIDRVRATLENIDLIVSQILPEVSQDSSCSVYFNGLLKNHSATSTAIVRSLYLTLRLHLVEALSLYVVAQPPVEETEDYQFFQTREWLLEHETTVHTLWDQVTAALASGQQDSEQNRSAPGTALRMFCLSWPFRAMLQSTMVSGQWKSRVLEVF
ncbi:hypothetical protein NM208_g3662 [Fusarium decemcellulare]|uniref:Uncharacterized protein n=1 Tax=Fusarium decemcellulare TaxID=57161 RepID=A0ACC1SNB5_9HYPO|nr:hypothetical protein NM208_g3662 [Fusarium decemcellulare]